jgi:hypothetical protein
MNDWTSLLSAIVPIFISIGITGWVYNVMKTMNESLKDEMKRTNERMESRISELEKELAKSHLNANNWFKKYANLRKIIKDSKCRVECPIKSKFDELQNEDEAYSTK